MGRKPKGNIRLEKRIWGSLSFYESEVIPNGSWIQQQQNKHQTVGSISILKKQEEAEEPVIQIENGQK